MMFFQDPSLLEFQRQMEEAINLNNLKTMFHVSAIPKDTQLRDVLDETPSITKNKITNTFFIFFAIKYDILCLYIIGLVTVPFSCCLLNSDSSLLSRYKGCYR